MPTTSSLQEMLIAAHLSAPPNATVLDVASWVEEFSGDYPAIQQLPPTPPVQLMQADQGAFGGAMMLGQSIMLGGPVVELPRMVLRSITTPFYVLYQADRIAFGWNRTKPLGVEEDYQGFDAVKAAFDDVARRFELWHIKRLGAPPSVRVAEISYINSVPMDLDGKQRRISEVFRWVQPSRPVNMFNVNWLETIAEHPGGAMVYAQALIGRSNIGERVFGFNYSGLAAADGLPSGETMTTVLHTLHERILDMHSAAIISEGSR